MTGNPQAPHPDFALLGESWLLALDADGYAQNTLKAYGRALGNFARWLAAHHPAVAPGEVTRDQVRAWIVSTREATSSGTARSHFPAVRHFYRWGVAEREWDRDPTEGIRTPPPNDPSTPVLSADEIRRLLATCGGRDRDFVARRDAAIIYVFIDGGVRLAECAGLTVDSVDIRNHILLVEGKGSNRSGPRRRAVPLGVKATRVLDSYLRERRRHPYHERPQLWLGGRNRPTLSADGIDAMLKRRAAVAGLKGLHPHVFRHSWASEARTAGLSEGDLMVLGGWRSRTMLDRYGKVAAADRAREAYRRLSYGDRL